MTLMLVGLIASAPVPSEVERFARTIRKTPQETCKAVLNLFLPDLGGKIAKCEKGKGSKVKKIFGNRAKCDPDDSGHYTLFDAGTKCQCNDAKHSELEILKRDPGIDVMTNVKNPCINCYMAIIKHLIDKDRLAPGKKLTINYHIRKDEVPALHQNLTDDCTRWFDETKREAEDS
jgi:hypothetical protein